MMINIRNSEPQWRNSPVGLTPEMLTDPYKVLDAYFYPSGHLPKYRKSLNKWLIAATIQNQNGLKRKELIQCIMAFQDMACLLDALWLIYQKRERFSESETKIRRGLDESRYRWSKRVHEAIILFNYKEDEFELQAITIEEEEEPFKVIYNFFENIDLFDAKENLEHWLNMAVNNPWGYDTIDKTKLYTIYEQMIRLVEAVFVIVEVRLLQSN